MSVNSLLKALKVYFVALQFCLPQISLCPSYSEVDASAVGAGAVLLQEDEQGINHPVSYFSRKFNKQQLKYSTIEKEALALLFGLQHFKVYLGSSVKPIKVMVDYGLQKGVWKCSCRCFVRAV